MANLKIQLKHYLLIIGCILILLSCAKTNSFTKIEMDLSSLGVESDDYPNYPTIHASINPISGLAICKKSYYDPKHKSSTYALSKGEIQQINELLNHTDLEKLKNKYAVTESDQPKSILTIYTDTKKIVIEDYGLKGEYPLQELYKIVYRKSIFE